MCKKVLDFPGRTEYNIVVSCNRLHIHASQLGIYADFILRRPSAYGQAEKTGKNFQEDGNAIITAFDHGSTSGPVPRYVDIDVPIKAVVDAGTDAVIVNIGVCEKVRAAAWPHGHDRAYGFPVHGICDGFA
jgi:hypothetical protein